MKMTLVLFAMLCSGCAVQEPFDGKDKARMTAVYAAIGADAVTTSRIAANPNISEGGPVSRIFLGSRPDAITVAAFAVAESFLARAVFRRVNEKKRRILQYLLIADHTLLGTIHNCRIDLC